MGEKKDAEMYTDKMRKGGRGECGRKGRVEGEKNILFSLLT